jgi:hypothetical protein
MTDFREDPSSADDFEVEVSALNANGEADVAFLAQLPLGPDLYSSARTRRLVIGCCAVRTALLVLASVPALRGQALSLLGDTSMPTSTPVYFSYTQLFPSQPQPPRVGFWRGHVLHHQLSLRAARPRQVIPADHSALLETRRFR